MNTSLSRLIVLSLLLGLSSVARAQVLTYLNCEVQSVPGVVDTISRLYGELAGGARPTLSLLDSVWNGADSTTHTIIAEHASIQALADWNQRIGSSLAAQLILQGSSEIIACPGDGLVIERGYWGDRTADWNFDAVYPSVVSNAARYAEAIEDLANSPTGRSAPGALILYQVRAGGDGATHFVVMLAPTLDGLNEYLETLFASDDYADFAREVGSIRTLLPASQDRRVRTWKP